MRRPCPRPKVALLAAEGNATRGREQQTKNYVQQAKAAQNAPQNAYTQGSMDDFAVINDNDDLPF